MPPVTLRPQPGRLSNPGFTPTVTRPTPVTTPSTPLRAPDGMEINAPGTTRTTGITRAEIIARAKKADVPQRVQIGPTCGLYALGMVMDSWHIKNPKNAAPLISDADLHGQGKNFNFAPTTDERVLDYAKKAGFTSQGEMFTAKQLAQTAAHFGYAASVHERATLEDLYKVLDKGHPAIVAFDVDWNGNPGDYGGQRAHYAVIEGYFEQNGERYLIAKHGWGVEKDHVWRAADFDRSWKALKTTDYYGTPGDGVIPREPGLTEPALLNLPDAGNGRAQIFESLGTKIVEVVPKRHKLAGGTRVDAPA
ncbi:MAG: C39 family peptidase [Myxococcota bacterium]